MFCPAHQEAHALAWSFISGVVCLMHSVVSRKETSFQDPMQV